MPNTHRKSSTSTGPPQSAFVEQLPDLRGEGELDNVLPEATAWLSTWADYQQDVVEFVSNRIAKDQEIVRSALTVYSFSDMLQIQSRWMTEASQDYSAEAIKFTALSTTNVPLLDPAVRFPE
jgi:hypothetical protein